MDGLQTHPPVPPRWPAIAAITLLVLGLAIPIAGAVLLARRVDEDRRVGSAEASGTHLAYRTIPVRALPRYRDPAAPHGAAPPPDCAFAVESPDGRHAYAMIASTCPEADRPFPRTGMYELGPRRRFLWAVPPHFASDPARVLVPDVGRHVVLYHDDGASDVDPGGELWFFREGEGAGARNLSRLGRGGRVEGEIDVAFDERNLLHVWIRDMGHYALDLEGTVVSSEEIATSPWSICGR